MTLVANYVGERNGEYWVNVKTANPSGKIGDGGVIRRFESKEDAKKYAKLVNETGVDTFEYRKDVQNNEPVRHEGDTFERS